MSFSVDKSVLLRPQKEKSLSTFLIALLTAGLIILPATILNGAVLGFSSNIFGQQLAFFERCHNAIRNGRLFSLQFLSGDFINFEGLSLLGSPFFWLTIPFKTGILPYVFAPLFIIKISLAALFSYFYIRRFTRTAKAARLGALLYSFSAFSIFGFSISGHYEAVIFFPILLLSLEYLVTEKRHFGFAISLCIFAISSPFSVIPTFAFLIIYLVIRACSKAIKITFSTFVTLIFETLLGVALSAFILLPILSLFFQNISLKEFLGFNAIAYQEGKTYLSIFSGLFLPATQNNLSGWIPLFSLTGVLTFFATKKGHWIKRILGVSLLIALVPILNWFFNAFGNTGYNSWLFMPLILICLATVILTENNTTNLSFGYKCSLFITVLLCLIFGLLPQKTQNGKIYLGLFLNQTSNSILNPMLKYWLICGVCILGLLVLYPILKQQKKNQKAFFKTSTTFVCVVAIIFGNLFMLGEYSAQKQYSMPQISLQESNGYKVDFYGDNTKILPSGYTPFVTDDEKFSCSLSKTFDFLKIENVTELSNEKFYPIKTLCSVKYSLNHKDDVSFINPETKEPKIPCYEYLETQDDYYIYQNKAYIPYGFSYDYMVDAEFCKKLNNEQRAHLLLKAVYLTDQQIEKYGTLFERLPKKEIPKTDDIDTYFDNCKNLSLSSAAVFKTHNSGFTAKVNRDKPTLVFFSIPYSDGWTATVNGKEAVIEQVNGSFMAVKVSNGESIINFNFVTPNLLTGLKITTVSAGVLLLYIVIFLIWQIKHKPTPCYPEGEALLNEWQQYELEQARASLDSHFDQIEKPSILDDSPDNEIPTLNEDFKGGFKIDIDL